MILPCPHCKYQYDISNLVAGDRLWCAFYDRWLMLAFHRSGNPYFVVVQAPVREKR